MTLFLGLAACSGGKGKGGGGGISSPSSGTWEFDPIDLSGAPSCFANDVDSSIELVHPKCKKGGVFVSDDQCDISTKPAPRPKTAAGALQWTHSDPTPDGILSVVGPINIINGSASLTCSNHYDARFDSEFTGDSIIFDCGSAGSADDNHYIPSLTRGSQVFYCASKVVQVSTGSEHTCALTSSGQVYCWGNNWYGQLGTGDTTERSTPTLVDGPHVFASISSGWLHTCALKSSGEVYCWGKNNFGQLGTGDEWSKDTPTLIQNHNFVSVSAGGEHTCARKDSGEVYCWGWNGYGQLGIGNTMNKNEPTLVEGHFFDSVSAGGGHTCAIEKPGQVYCWGYNSYYQLGIGGFSTPQTLPTLVAGSHDDFTYVSAGEYHTCAIKDTGDVYCWGFNDLGQLGTGDNISRNEPTLVPGHEFTSVSAGGYHTCARKDSGEVYCWGENSSGQLGIGNNLSQNLPTKVIGPYVFSSVSVGEQHTCATTTSGHLYCWGYNGNSQVGDPYGESENTPKLTAPF